MKKRKNFALTLAERRKIVDVMESCTTGQQVVKAYLWYSRVILQREQCERRLNGDKSPVLDELNTFEERMFVIYERKDDEVI